MHNDTHVSQPAKCQAISRETMDGRRPLQDQILERIRAMFEYLLPGVELTAELEGKLCIAVVKGAKQEVGESRTPLREQRESISLVTEILKWQLVNGYESYAELRWPPLPITVAPRPVREQLEIDNIRRSQVVNGFDGFIRQHWSPAPIPLVERPVLSQQQADMIEALKAALAGQ